MLTLVSDTLMKVTCDTMIYIRICDANFGKWYTNESDMWYHDISRYVMLTLVRGTLMKVTCDTMIYQDMWC